MKKYKSQNEVIADIKDGVLAVNEDVKFECSIAIEAKIIVQGNINAGDINAGDINAWNINAGDINAGDINAWNINARDIDAGNIKYYAACLSYKNITCTSITAKREKHCDPVCLDGKLTIKPKEDDEVNAAIKLLTEKGKLVDGKILN